MKVVDYIFFVGTDAELIKVFPVMLEMKKRSLSFGVVSSGQNDITRSFVLTELVKVNIDLELSKESSIKKSAKGLLSWFLATGKDAANKIASVFDLSNKPIVIVHGDTVSTVMGARVSKKLGLECAHVEAGLRSHNWFSPFPEEIDRHIVSKCATYHFAPGDQAVNNLAEAKAKGKIVNTMQNTLLDSLEASRSVPCQSSEIQEMVDSQHYVLVLHRQENLANEALVRRIHELSAIPAGNLKCVFIMHAPTEVTLKKMSLYDDLADAEHVYLPPRIEYCDFMKLLATATYVITDGGSNQEELFYMGIPALILRKESERSEGLGHNSQLYNGDTCAIDSFLNHYEDYRKPPIDATVSPSSIIVDCLQLSR